MGVINCRWKAKMVNSRHPLLHSKVGILAINIVFQLCVVLSVIPNHCHVHHYTRMPALMRDYY